MQNQPPITIVGNVVADPELRYTPSGVAVTNFRVAQTPRQFNKQTNQYEEGEALFLSCNVWRQAAENVANSIAKGDRVIVHGRLSQRSYDDREGNKRTVYEVEVDEVGPSLRYATATATKNPRDNQGGGWNNQPQGQQPQQGGGWNNPQQGQQPQQGSQGYNPQGGNQQGYNPQQGGMTPNTDDPWNSAPQGQQGQFSDQEPPL